jgi:N-glycosylase/DNA lyase
VIGRRALRLSERATGVLVEAVDGRPADGLAEAVSRYLSLDADLGAFSRRFADDPCLGPAIRGYAGLRLLRQDPWECLVSFICSATSNIPRIKLNVGSVACVLGDRTGPGARDFAFPSPDVIAAAGETKLRQLGLGFRAKSVAQAAEAVASGKLEFEPLRQVSYDAARAALMSLHGVGEKIADCVLAFSLDKPEAFPVDRWTRRALEEWYGLPPELNNTRAGEWARARFGEHGAIAQQYVFHRERLGGRARAWGGGHMAKALPEDVSSPPRQAGTVRAGETARQNSAAP